jgi:hypothetical protein
MPDGFRFRFVLAARLREGFDRLLIGSRLTLWQFKRAKVFNTNEVNSQNRSELAEKIKQGPVRNRKAWRTHSQDAGNLASCSGCIAGNPLN